jgi:hypothetical protein
MSQQQASLNCQVLLLVTFLTKPYEVFLTFPIQLGILNPEEDYKIKKR